MGIRFEMFHGLGMAWQDLFREAAAFADKIDPERLISISQSSDQQDAVVCVWYWAEEAPAAPATPPAAALEATAKKPGKRPRKEKGPVRGR